MFTPPNPNDRPLRQRQFAFLQLMVLVTVVCIWAAAARIAWHPETSHAMSEFLRSLVAISGGALMLYALLLMVRYVVPWISSR